jgi:hypothetical protein
VESDQSGIRIVRIDLPVLVEDEAAVRVEGRLLARQPRRAPESGLELVRSLPALK